MWSHYVKHKMWPCSFISTNPKVRCLFTDEHTSDPTWKVEGIQWDITDTPYPTTQHTPHSAGAELVSVSPVQSAADLKVRSSLFAFTLFLTCPIKHVSHPQTHCLQWDISCAKQCELEAGPPACEKLLFTLLWFLSALLARLHKLLECTG